MKNATGNKGFASLPVKVYGRQLLDGQTSVLAIFDIVTGERHVVLTSDSLIEAPNWTPDGRHLIVNGGGQLWKVGIEDDAVERIDTDRLSDLNNDHVLAPDGKTIYVSSNDGHLYKVDIAGGRPVRISNDHSEPFTYFLHGVSPDERELAYVAVEGAGATALRNIYTISASGGPDIRLTDIPQPNDGPEYSADGQWIYFNSEMAASKPGHAQIFRMKRDGSGIEQLTFDERVNWFPHISPDGKQIVYLSYPPGTVGHPPNHDILLRLMAPDGGPARDLTSFHGGQGTINVNSWAPDSRRFAYVEYPLGEPARGKS
jgi:Tol biopolymer transport system component